MLYRYLLALLLARPALAQVTAAAASDTTYYEATDERRVASSVDTSRVCTELLRWGPHQGLLRTYYPSGALASYVPYADVDQRLRHGHSSEWYDNGQLRVVVPYVRGRRQGPMLCYYEDGRLRRQTEYEAGRERPGGCYDEAGRPVPFFPYEQPPLYPGGYEQLTRELNKRAQIRRLSAWSVKLPVTSVVLLSFSVDEAGRLSRVWVEKPSLMPEFDQAVAGALGQLDRAWVPGQRDGRPAAFTYLLRVPLTRASGPGYLWSL